MAIETQARDDLILELIALSGDFPESLLGKLAGNEQWTRQVVRSLVRDKLIRKYQKDGIKSLRLTKRGRELLLEANPERFHDLLCGAGAIRSKKSDILTRHRLHQFAGSYVLMIQAGVLVHKDEKEPLPYPFQASVSLVSFYSSIELKSDGMDMIRIKSTRAVGLLLPASGSPFLVYNTGSAVLKWSSRSEWKMAGVVEEILGKSILNMKGIHGLMIGERMETSLLLLNSTGGYRNQLYRVDGTFPALHFIPLDRNGVEMVRLLSSDVSCRKLSCLLDQSMTLPKFPRYVCDAMDGDIPVLLACTFDLPRIRKFRGGLEQFGEKGRIICFDFQGNVLNQYFGELAEICTLHSPDVWRWLSDRP